MDFTTQLEDFLRMDRREPDGKLHCSSALTDNLRHVQLSSVDAPTKGEDLMSMVRMMTGTLWHDYLDQQFTNLEGYVVETEVKLDGYMHPLWSGTCDMLIRKSGANVWSLYDYKVVNPMSLPWVARSGGKIDHKWQVSAYYYAAKQFIKEKWGQELDDLLRVVYMPAFTDNKVSAPFIAAFPPIDKEVFDKEQMFRTTLVQEYQAQYDINLQYHNEYLVDPELWEYKKVKEKVVRKPHWRSRFCPYVGQKVDGMPLCGCDTLSQKTLGSVEQFGYLMEEA
jgi:hypothetical protein